MSNLVTLQQDDSSPSDEDLMAAFQNDKDYRSFDELYRRYLPRIQAFIKKSCPECAVDLAQDTFASVLGKADQFNRAKGSFKAWVYAIAHNHVISYVKRVRDRYVSMDEEIPSVANIPRVERVMLSKCFKKLGPVAQTVIYLTVQEGFTVAEVATILGRLENTVSALKRRALKFLADCLEAL